MNTDTAIRTASDRLIEELESIGTRVLDDEGKAKYTLADAIREGSSVSDQAYNWSDEAGGLCALSAAAAAVEARGL